MIKIKYNQKELEILIFISYFGRSYAEVLGKTFYKSVQGARNKISHMKKKGLIKLVPTGLTQPRNAVTLPKSTKDLLLDLGYIPKVHRGSISQIHHNIIEQIAYYHLSKLGEVTRTSVWHHKNTYHAVPDLIVQTQIHTIAIEVETHQKGNPKYKDFVKRSSQDNFDRILYITPNKKLMKTIANNMPTWDKLFFIDIETMIENINIYNKIKPYSQKQLLKD
ncbi:MAG: hypothetical protein LWW95_11410 [Candidatus Desulfofervidus auxilii]|nr:hypothetical protein [Candidatus Desulfofervidus auxilii]